MTKDDLKAVLDIGWREKAIFAPLIVLVFWMGIYPATFIDMMSASVDNLIDNHAAAVAAAQDLSVAGVLGLE